jgi:hypothetical protein
LDGFIFSVHTFSTVGYGNITFGQTVHGIQAYKFNQVISEVQFADILSIAPNGTRVIDYSKFNDLR